MISARRVLIADRITRIAADTRANFKDDSRREISGAVFAREPVGRDRDFFVDRLFESKLAARAISVGRDHVLAEEISAESNPRAPLERLLRHRIGISAGVVGAVADRNENVIADNHCPTVIAAVVKLPL